MGPASHPGIPVSVRLRSGLLTACVLLLPLDCPFFVVQVCACSDWFHYLFYSQAPPPCGLRSAFRVVFTFFRDDRCFAVPIFVFLFRVQWYAAGCAASLVVLSVSFTDSWFIHDQLSFSRVMFFVSGLLLAWCSCGMLCGCPIPCVRFHCSVASATVVFLFQFLCVWLYCGVL